MRVRSQKGWVWHSLFNKLYEHGFLKNKNYDCFLKLIFNLLVLLENSHNFYFLKSHVHIIYWIKSAKPNLYVTWPSTISIKLYFSTKVICEVFNFSVVFKYIYIYIIINVWISLAFIHCFYSLPTFQCQARRV